MKLGRQLDKRCHISCIVKGAVVDSVAVPRLADSPTVQVYGNDNALIFEHRVRTRKHCQNVIRLHRSAFEMPYRMAPDAQERERRATVEVDFR